jgi:L-rhamnose isomerase
VRAGLGAAEDPIAALRDSGYADRVAAERENQEITT